MPRHDYRPFFPFDDVRSEQDEAIRFAIDAFESGKKYVVLELPTGIGKSAIGLTVARYMNQHGDDVLDAEGLPVQRTSYVLTTQKILQDQYVKDFGEASGRDVLRSIKSSSNYSCGFYSGSTCADSRRLMRLMSKEVAGTEFERHCKSSKCPYASAKAEFEASLVSLTNFPFFLASKNLSARSTLVIDECHNAESELAKFVEVSFSERFAKDILKCKVPKIDSQQAAFDWVCASYKRALLKHQKSINERLKSGDRGENSRQAEMLEKHVEKVLKFIQIYDESNWVMNVVYPKDGAKRGFRRFEFKPVDVSHFGGELFGNVGRILMMSATIVDKDVFCRSIGIPVDDAAYLRLASPFSVENRPVLFMPVGSMSKSNIDRTLPKLVETIKEILAIHPDSKGIIHTANYRIAKHIQDSIPSDRFVFHEASNREEALKFHLASKDPTVIVSPSMMEGVDLSDDASRFQVICKIPFPYLGDLMVKRRMERDSTWYPYVTAKSIIQSLGRSIRNKDDHAMSYILDSDWTNFYARNERMFTDDFRLALHSLLR